MRCDFSKVEDMTSFVSVPAGTYPCKVVDARPGSARDGSERWSLRLEVLDGEYAGRTAAWDSLTWSERGVVRVNRVLAALGFDVTGELEIEPDDLMGLTAMIQVIPEEWEDPSTGRRQERMTVPYLGWEPHEAGATATNGKDGVDDPGGDGEALAHDSAGYGDQPF